MKLTKIKTKLMESDCVNWPIKFKLKYKRSRILKPIEHLVSKNFEHRYTSKIVEEPFVFRNIPEKCKTVLEFGCNGSILPINLASLGYKVTGIGMDDCLLTHPNFIFIRDDLITHDFGKQQFDCITSVSTIEHCGYKVYGQKEDREAIGKARDKLHSLLKDDGTLIQCVPYGYGQLSDRDRSHREFLFSKETIPWLMNGFKITKMELYSGIDTDHVKPTIDSYLRKGRYGECCMVAKKVKK